MRYNIIHRNNSGKKNLLRSFCFLVFVFIASNVIFTKDAYAADTTWTGVVSADWATAGNWSLSAVPTSADNVTVPDAGTTNNDPNVSAGAACSSMNIQTNGILNGNGQTISVYGNWTNSGIFNHQSGTVYFGGGSNSTFTPGASGYYNIVVSRYNYDDLTISGTVTVENDLTHTDGELYSGQINLAGDYIIGAAAGGNTPPGSPTVVNFNGAGDQAIVYNAGGTGSSIRVDKSSGVLTVSDDIVVCGWAYAQGTVTGLDTHTLIFGDDANSTFTPGSFVYNNIELRKSGYDTLSVSGTGTVAGNLTHTSGEFAGGQLNLGGNYIVKAGAEGGSVYGTSTVINFNHATNNQTIVYSAGGTAAQVRIDKVGGTFAVNDNIVVCGWTYAQGTITGLDTHTLIFGDNYNSSFTPGSLVYGDIELNKSYYDNLAVNGTAIISGNVTHTNGEFGGGQMNVSGNYIIGANAKGGADSSWPTILNLNGIGDQNIIYSSGGTGTTVRIDKTSGSLTVPGNLGVSSWNYIQGAVIGIDSCSLKLGDDFHNSFNPGNLVYHDVAIRETGGYDSFTVSSNLNMNGDLSFTRGNLHLDTNNPSINLGGDFSISAGTTFTKGSGTITFIGTDPSTFTDASATPQNIGKVAVNKTNADEAQNALTLLSSMTCNTLNVDGTLGQIDTLNLGSGGYTLTLANAGNIASVFTQNGTTVPGNSTVKYSATNSAGNINIAVGDFNNLQLAGGETYALAGTTTLNGDLIIGVTSILTASSNTLNLAGDFQNSGVFTPGTGTVNMNGVDQSISGSNSFYNLNKDIGSSDTLTFNAGTTTTILAGGSLVLTGENRDNRLMLQGSVPDTPWNLNLQSGATYNLDYLNVADSNLTGEPLTVLNSISSGGNTSWTIINNTATGITAPSINVEGGIVTIRTTASDIDHDNISLKIEYSQDNGSTWHDPYLSSITSTLNTPTLTNASEYQITGISTTSDNTITILWDTKSEQNELSSVLYENDIKIRITPYDGTDIGSSQTSLFFEVNNRSAVFVPSAKPDLSDIQIFSDDNIFCPANLPTDIAQIAISATPDFWDVSYQDITEAIDLSSFNSDTVYLKFRTSQGSTSDTIAYNRIFHGTTADLKEGDIVKTNGSFDLYIIKYKNGKQYKRLILSPNVFNSYQHLKWENIKIISQAEMDRYVTSNLVKETNDTIIYELFPDGDIGQRKVLDVSNSYDSDGVYEINKLDRDNYTLKK